MKTIATTIFGVIALTTALDTAAVDAAAAEALIKSNDCLACHTVDTKLVGPSYQEVANKYQDDPDAKAKLIKKIKEGGSGVWGAVPMTPHPNISDADLKTLVDWVLSLKQ